MANIRFARVVEHSGRPEVYLILTDPKRDAHFQAALKAHRLMTIQHGSGGSQASFGTVGYLPEVRGEVLLFPRSLRTFADDRIVGINFDLLEQEREPVEEEKPAPQIVPKPKAIAEKKFEQKEQEPDPVPKSPAQAHPRSQPASQRKGKGKRAQADDHPELPLEREAPRPPAKVISFHEHEVPEAEEPDGDESAGVAELKKEIRRALKALEAGKQVAAFSILKKLLE
jgi:hypothetical protein